MMISPLYYAMLALIGAWFISIIYFVVTAKMSFGDKLVCWFGAGTWRGPKGTWGSLMALPWAIALYIIGGATALVIASIIVYLVGIVVCDKYVERTGEKDPSFAVIDEVAGQFIALSTASLNPITLILGFFLFRFFDITKIQPARYLESLPKGLGIMSDDMVAGAYAAACLYGLQLYFPEYLVNLSWLI